jgi:tetratricopeptide (TPR) repeat protein
MQVGWSLLLALHFGLWLVPVQAQEQRQPGVGAADAEISSLIARANRLHQVGNYAEAEPLIWRALAIAEKSFGPEHPSVAGQLITLAQLLQATNRLAEAEPLIRRALAVSEKSLGPDHPDVAIIRNNLVLLDFYKRGFELHQAGKYAEAVPIAEEYLAFAASRFDEQHPLYANGLRYLGLLYLELNLHNEAEPILRRALAIHEMQVGYEHPDVARDLNELAFLLQATNRLAEAEPLMRRALIIQEKSLGSDHPDVAVCLDSLARLLGASNRLAEAEPLARRALTIQEKSRGPDHRIADVGIYLNDLAQILAGLRRLNEAEPLYRRALESLGDGHPTAAGHLSNLAILLAERGDWPAAAALGQRATPILIGRRDADGGDRSGFRNARLTGNTWFFRAHARAIYRAGTESGPSREEGFALAQWALQTSAAQALSQMSARSAKGTGQLAQLVRKRQDAFARRAAEERNLLAALGHGDAPAAESARENLTSLGSALDILDARLLSEFKEYAELTNPRPLTIAAVQALLNDDEALVLFLDVPQFGNLGGETLMWVVTRTDAQWGAHRACKSVTCRTRCGASLRIGSRGLGGWGEAALSQSTRA